MSAAAEEIDFELTLDRPQASLDFQLVPGSINTNICSTTEEGEITSIEDVNDDGDSVFEQSRAKRQRVGAPFNLVPRAKQRPRIVKSDFRRNYVLMWANLFNAGDPDLLSRHIETYYHPDLVFSQTVLHSGISPPLSKPTTHGRHFLQTFWNHCMVSTPDLVCAVKHTVVKVRADGTSSIRFSFEVSGTQLISPASDVDSCCAAPKTAIAKHQVTHLGSTAAAIAAVAPSSLYTNTEANQMKPAKARRQKSAENPVARLGLGEGDWDYLACLLDDEDAPHTQELGALPRIPHTNVLIPWVPRALDSLDCLKFACLGSFEMQLDSNLRICAIHLNKITYAQYPAMSSSRLLV